MQWPEIQVALWQLAVAGFAALTLTWVAFATGRWMGRRTRIAASHEGARRQMAGRVAELWAPYTDGFPGEVDEAYFLGAPIDFVVFEGMSDGEIEEIVFVEVKSGDGKLTRRERMIRDAVIDGRVSWLEHRLD